MVNTFELVEERATKRLYKLSKPVAWREYLILADAWVDRLTDYVIVSLGRLGDTAIFPAEADGSITEFDPLYQCDNWIVDFDAFMREWLEVLEYEEHG